MLHSFKTLSALVALAGATAIVAVPSADAREYHRTIQGKTSYSYKTVNQARNVTKYRDVNNTRYVNRVHRIVNVTRVQPITRVNMVTRVRNQTLVSDSNRYSHRTQMLGPRYSTTGQTVRINHGCGNGGACGGTSTSYRYHTVQKVNNVTRYRDVTNNSYVQRINNHVAVTRVQPIIHTNVITRVHDRTVVVPKTVSVSQTQYLPGRTYTTSKVIQINGGTRYIGSSSWNGRKSWRSAAY